MLNVPVRFTGPEDEARANRRSHRFFVCGDPEDGEVRCGSCDCRPSHVAADYPCGVDVPRQVIG